MSPQLASFRLPKIDPNELGDQGDFVGLGIDLDGKLFLKDGDGAAVSPGPNIIDSSTATPFDGIIAGDGSNAYEIPLGDLVTQDELASALAPYLTSSNAATTYAALTGATFTGEIVSPLIALRGGLNSTRVRLDNIYVSEDNRESGYVRWAGSGFRIGTERGSSGGFARSIFLETDGLPRFDIDNTGQTNIVSGTDTRVRIGRGEIRAIVSGDLFLMHQSQSAIANYALRQSSGGNTQLNTPATGTITLSTGNTGKFFVNQNLVFSTVPFNFRPASSVVLSTNGDFTFEMTSNTNGNIVFRGNDGVMRRFNFTVS